MLLNIYSPVGISPMLPKRLARMELDVINTRNPFIEVTPPIIENPDSGFQESGFENRKPDNHFDVGGLEELEEEVFEEIEPPEMKNNGKNNEINASSAFDTAIETVYV